MRVIKEIKELKDETFLGIACSWPLETDDK